MVGLRAETYWWTYYIEIKIPHKINVHVLVVYVLCKSN